MMQKLTTRWNSHALLIAGLAALAPAIQSSEVSYSSLPGNDVAFGTAAEYRSHWSTLEAAYPVPPAGFGDANIALWSGASNGGLIPGGATTSLAHHFQVDFYLEPGEAGPFWVEIGPDFGLGGAVFLDGTAVAFNNDNLWWAGSWADPNELLSWNGALGAGSHRLDVYGQEDCCDGGSAGRYSLDGLSWTFFGSGDELNRPTGVPDAGSTGLALTLALSGLAWLNRRAQRN